MKVKCGRYEYDLISSDVIMDNGSVILILSRITLNGGALRMARTIF